MTSTGRVTDSSPLVETKLNGSLLHGASGSAGACMTQQRMMMALRLRQM